MDKYSDEGPALNNAVPGRSTLANQKSESELITELRYINELTSDNYYAVEENGQKLKPLRAGLPERADADENDLYSAIHETEAGALIREIAEKLKYNTRNLRTITQETRV